MTFGCDGTIILSNAISLTTAVSIDSGGHNVGISGGGKVRIFEIGIDGVVRLKGLKLIDGFARGADGAPAAEGRGGGVLVSEGQLHATDCALVNNLTVGGAGVEFPGAAAYGGAIFEAPLQPCPCWPAEMNFSPGTHRVVFAGETGRTYILSGSSNLPTWTPLQTNVMSSSQIFDYFETDAGSPSHHLFKVESP